MNSFLSYLADKHSAHRPTHRHTPLITRPAARCAQVITTAEDLHLKSTSHIQLTSYKYKMLMTQK